MKTMLFREYNVLIIDADDTTMRSLVLLRVARTNTGAAF